VPSENFDAAYRELRGLGKVLARSRRLCCRLVPLET
jgi:hypothetical protein